MHKLEDIKVWKKAVDISVEIYQQTHNFPQEEIYGLTSQIRRSAISIPSNIAEGAGRKTPKEFIRFLKIANGSCFELKTQIIISNKLNFISEQNLNSLLLDLNEIQKMIYGFIKKLEEYEISKI